MRVYTSYGWRDDEQRIASHWGVPVKLDEPTTGVVQNNRVEWLNDACYEGGAIDLAWEDHLKECKGDEHGEHDHCGPDEHGDMLIGSWKKDVNGLYEPDPDAASAEYAAIVGEVYTQVVWSKTVVRVRDLCSPCYPGQADVEHDKLVTEGGYLAYDLPADIYGE